MALSEKMRDQKHTKKTRQGSLFNAETEECPGVVSGTLQEHTTQTTRDQNAIATPLSMLKLKSVPGAVSGTLQTYTTQETHEKQKR